jgi:hypothetical protein
MKRINKIILALLILWREMAYSQSDTAAHSFTYYNQLLTGALVGTREHGTYFTASMIHGLRRKRISTGIGISYDAYEEWRTLPVFINLNYDLFSIKRNSVFLQLNGGYAKAWHINPQSEGGYAYDEKGGRMFHPSIGYNIKAEKWRLYVLAGCKLQRINYSQAPSVWIWGPSATTYEIKRDANRLTIQLGFGWR